MTSRWYPILLLTIFLGVNLAQAAPVCTDLFHREPVRAVYAVHGGHYETAYRELSLQDFEQTSAAAWYFSLSANGGLFSQTDVELVWRGYALPNGGLCGPTCVINLTKALTSRIKVTAGKNKIQLMNSLLSIYRSITREDGRFGTYLDKLLTAAEYLYHDAAFKFEKMKQSDIYARGLQKKMASGESLALLSVRFVEEKESNYHAMVLLKVDPLNEVLALSDPNHPEHVYFMPYFTGADGFIHTHVMPIYGRSSTEVTIREAAIISIGKSFAKKSNVN